MEEFMHCKECGKLLMPTSSDFMCCPDGHGKAQPKPKGFTTAVYEKVMLEKDYPSATVVPFYGNYSIDREEGKWAIVGDAKRGDQCEEGEVIAAAWKKGKGRKLMKFRRV